MCPLSSIDAAGIRSLHLHMVGSARPHSRGPRLVRCRKLDNVWMAGLLVRGGEHPRVLLRTTVHPCLRLPHGQQSQEGVAGPLDEGAAWLLRYSRIGSLAPRHRRVRGRDRRAHCPQDARYGGIGCHGARNGGHALHLRLAHGPFLPCGGGPLHCVHVLHDGR